MAAYHSLDSVFEPGLLKAKQLMKLMRIIFNMIWSEDMSNVRKSSICKLFTDSNDPILQKMMLEALEPYKCDDDRYNIKSYFDVSEKRTETMGYVDINKILQKT